MRECWINVYPGIMLDGRVFCGKPQPSRGHCDVSAIGWAAAEDSGRSVAKDLRYVGVGYRLHVRLKPGPARIEDPYGNAMERPVSGWWGR